MAKGFAILLIFVMIVSFVLMFNYLPVAWNSSIQLLFVAAIPFGLLAFVIAKR